MITRVGKIARLPLAVRTELNERLQNGESHRNLVAWLNGLPPVQETMAREFGGRPISAPNMTAWKQGGYMEWEMRRKIFEQTRILTREYHG
ncbi:MAG: hypothetical protein JWR19_2215 [Pedosphaera sp.]|nr:hypothetical protein [Pedosphaera sp.]